VEQIVNILGKGFFKVRAGQGSAVLESVVRSSLVQHSVAESAVQHRVVQSSAV
jgi:hypothetical protein